MTTTQTPTGCITSVTMQPASGAPLPTIVYLPDATSVVPNALGQIQVPYRFVSMLQNAGFVTVSSGNS